jgi:OFA family oxalate/formate antiporter-like MFS transporter
MFMAFAIEAVGILALSKYGQSPVAFVILTGIVFFAWGEIYSLFPATCGDTFGPKFAATNAGLLYTAKGTAALLVPFSSVITAATGSWHAVFMLASGMAALSALLALFVLKPMRQAHKQKHAAAPMDMPFASVVKE